jgi:hypothetical protein
MIPGPINLDLSGASRRVVESLGPVSDPPRPQMTLEVSWARPAYIVYGLFISLMYPWLNIRRLRHGQC